MTCCRDYQKSRVYSWENQFPRGGHVTFDNLQRYVDCIWHGKLFNLKWPPIVYALAPQERKAIGKGNRASVLFPLEGSTELVILHELAHSMTSTADGHTDAHGPKFVGVYMRLLCEHLNVPLPLLMYSATRAGIDYDIHAKPWCGK